GGRRRRGGLRRGLLHRLRLEGRHYGLGLLHDRRRGLGAAVEIGDSGSCLVRRGRRKFVGDGACKALFTSATPAATAAASTASRPPLAIRALIGAGKGRLLVGLFVLGKSVVG